MLGWYLLAAAVTALGLALLPLSLAAPLAAGGWGYGLFVDFLHSRFHLRDHILSRSRAFLYLQRVHDIHHIDQTKNFTIVLPLMDVLFGTYLGHLPGTGVRPAGPEPAAA